MLCLQVKSPSRPRDTEKTVLYARKAFQCGPRKQTYGRSQQFDLPLKKKSLVCSLENHTFESLQTAVSAGCNLNNNACDTCISANFKGNRNRLVWWHGLFRNIATNYRLTYTYSNICDCI